MLTRTVRLTLPLVAVALCLLTGCSRTGADANPPYTTDLGTATELRLGYSAGVDQAPVLAGLTKSVFSNKLGSTKLTPVASGNGPEAVTALLGGSLDAAFVDVGAAIDAYAKSPDKVRLISGVTSNGVELVVRPTVTKPADLAGKTVATLRAGSAPDVALRKWLAANELTSKVKVATMDDSLIVSAFQKGLVDAAWVSEPTASTLAITARANVLIDEAALWPRHVFPTVVLVARSQYVSEHPATVTGLLEGLIASIELVDPVSPDARQAVQATVNDKLGKKLSPPVLHRAIQYLRFDVDPYPPLILQLAQDRVAAGTQPQAPALAGFADFQPLDKALAGSHRSTVAPAGLGPK
ncbi:ABC transporter substrate-binding protein [Kribbella sp. NPDC058245]|uniref:ABC transporter substrate-binding protein n=1 Tax=Kribbella sp. NPDC058245 TaxID=3346399 RepID=UPI0036EE6EC7